MKKLVLAVVVPGLLSGCIAAVAGASLLANEAVLSNANENSGVETTGEELLKMVDWKKTKSKSTSNLLSSAEWSCGRPARVCVEKAEIKPKRGADYKCGSAGGGAIQTLTQGVDSTMYCKRIQ